MTDQISFLEEKINNIQFTGLENVKIGDMLHYVYIEDLPKRYVVNAVYHMIMNSIFEGNEFEVKGRPDKIILFSNAYSYRTDLLISFNKVYNACTDIVKMVGKKNGKLHVSFIKYLKYVFIWNSELKKIIPEVSLRLYYLEKIHRAFIDYKEYEAFVEHQNWKIEKLITWCDVHLVDYFFTQKFLQENFTTMTLQHGVFSSESNSWTFTNSKSDYFLVHGQFTMDEASRVNYDIRKMIPVGLPSSINEQFEDVKTIDSIKIIGVIPEGESCHDDNIELIQFVQDYCREYGLKMFLKLHPTSNQELYDDIIDSSVCERIYGRNISIIDFGKIIDIAILRNSTALLEMIEQMIPAFVFYSEKQTLKVFKYVDAIRFENKQELKDLIDQLADEKVIDVLRERKKYFCSEGNISSNYKNAITYNCVDGEGNE